MALYIDLGTNVEPNWTGLLATSSDGVIWNTFNLVGANVTYHTITGNTDSPLVDNALEAHITISNDHQDEIHFGLRDIVNQVTWTHDLLGLDTASEDIGGWIGTANAMAGGGGGGTATEGTLLSVLAAVDGLEFQLSTAGDVNLNIDALEALIGTTNSLITTVDGVLDSIALDTTSIAAEDFATEAKLELVRLRLVDILDKVTLIEADTDAINTNTSGSVETPSLLTTSLVGTVLAGASTVSIFNSGAATGTVLGSPLLSGLAVSYQVSDLNNTLSAISYDASATTFIISETR